MIKRKKVVVQLIRSAGYGGVEKHVQDLVSKCSDNYDVTIISLTNTIVSDDFKHLGVKIICLGDKEKASLSSCANIYKLAQAIKSVQPDIVHMHGTRPFIIGNIASLIAGVRFRIVTLHSSYKLNTLGRNCESDPKKEIIWKLIYMLGIIMSNKIICVCREIESEIYSFIPNVLLRPLGLLKKMCVIHNWVDLSKYTPAKRLISDRIILGLLSRFDEPSKGITILLYAMNDLRKAGYEVSLKLGGDGHSKKKLIHLCEILSLTDIVEFVGYVKDTKKFFNSIDILVLPSFSEGFPLVILEAMASAIPVIATNVGGVREAVENGVTGIIVNAGSKDEIVEAVKKFIHNKGLITNMGISGKDIVSTKFSITCNTDKTMQLYE